MITVSIADSHPVTILGLKYLLASNSKLKLLDSYSTGKELLAGLQDRQPDILLLDVQLPDMDGLEAVMQIKNAYPQIRIFAFTALDDSTAIKSFRLNGCEQYILKATNTEDLLTTIEQAYSNEEPVLRLLGYENTFRIPNYRKKINIKAPDFATMQEYFFC